MISIYYKIGEHIEISSNISILQEIDRENIIWVDMTEWDKEEEILLEKHFDLKIMNPNEVTEIEQSARFIEFDHYFVCNSNFITKYESTLIQRVVSFTLTRHILITLRSADFRAFRDTAKKILTSGSKTGTSEVFLSLFDNRIANDADYVEELTQQVSELSKAITTEKQTSKPLIIKLNNLRENLMLMMQNCIEKKLFAGILKRTEYLNSRTLKEIDISVKDLESVIDYIRFNFERLDYIDSTLNHLITYEQNNSMKIFTIVSLFFMPPMLIASVYGMNFRIMPELEHKYGYEYALGFMLLTVILTFIYFKRKKWL